MCPRRFCGSQIRLLYVSAIELKNGTVFIDSPSNEVLSLGSQWLVGREREVSRPVDNLAVSVVRLLGTEWRPANQALEHDGTNTPPVTSLVVTLATEDLGRNVIRRTDGGVRELPARLAPRVDLVAV